MLGCRVSAPGRPCRDMAPGPRCSGPGSVLGVPTLLPWTLPATPCTGTVPTDTGGTKGRDCHRCDEQWCHTGQRCALTQPWGVVAWMWWHWVALPQHILVSQPSCQGSMVPGLDTPRAGACPWHGCWWGSGWVGAVAPTSLPQNSLCLVLSPSPRTVWRRLDQY